MLEAATTLAVASIGAAMALSLYRLIAGPDAADRVLALDTLYINTVALMIVLGIRSGSALTFDAALIIALTGFVATVALARFLARGDVMD